MRTDTLEYVIIPALSEEGSKNIREDALLVVDVIANVLGPHHEVSNLVARRRAVNAPFELFPDFFS